jgi:hypothetical protein
MRTLPRESEECVFQAYRHPLHGMKLGIADAAMFVGGV